MPSWAAQLCSDVRPSAVEWLWRGYVPKGKLTVLDGEPEVGKSFLTIDLAARLSRGGPLPDGQTLSRPYTSLLLFTEDDVGDTVRPRAEAAAADLGRLVLATTLDGRTPRFPDDIPALEELIRGLGVEFAVIDPLMAFLPPRVAANLDQCVRLALTPLGEMAARTGCGIVLVRHLTKRGGDRAMHRGQGSMGIVGACRVALLAAERPGHPDEKVLAVVKSNVGRHAASLGYRVRGADDGRAVVEWTGPVGLTADEACRPPEQEKLRPRERARDWLRQQLANGPRKAAELDAAAAEAGIPDRTLDRAKADLKARSCQVHREGKGVWYWYDPCAPWPANAPFKKPFELPPLDPL